MNYRVVIETKESESGWRDEKIYRVQQKQLTKTKRFLRSPKIEEVWVDILPFPSIGRANEYINNIVVRA